MIWNVIIEDNGKIKPYNVFNNRLFNEAVAELITNIEYKDISRDELSEIIKRKAQWQFWSRCEYEVLILSWPPYKDEKGYKMDVYEQLLYNWDRFIDYIISYKINQMKEVTIVNKYIQHIPTGCCYELESDGKTVEICGCMMQPEIDGEVFWRYMDHYIEKEIIPVDPFKRG